MTAVDATHGSALGIVGCAVLFALLYAAGRQTGSERIKLAMFCATTGEIASAAVFLGQILGWAAHR